MTARLKTEGRKTQSYSQSSHAAAAAAAAAAAVAASCESEPLESEPPESEPTEQSELRFFPQPAQRGQRVQPHHRRMDQKLPHRDLRHLERRWGELL